MILQTMAMLLLTICLVACEQTGPEPSATPLPADRVFLHGGVYTVNPDMPWAEAAATRGNEIIFVGSDADVNQFVGPETELVDLSGKMLLPGLHDSHVHLMDGGMFGLQCDLEAMQSIEAMRNRLAECTEIPGIGDEKWVFGGRWNRVPFGGENPDKTMLDEYFPDRPVFLYTDDGHTLWANSMALELADINRDTAEVPGGKIERDPETGEPTGIFNDKAMMLISDIAPRWSLEERIAGIEHGMAQAHHYGITSIIEPGLDVYRLEPYAKLDKRGGLQLRVVSSLSPINWVAGAFGPEVLELINARDQYSSPNINTDSVKIYIDGVIENYSAALLDPYSDEKHSSGKPFYSQQEFDDWFIEFDRRGLQIHVHAIGDLGVRMALNAFEAMRNANGPTDNRHQIVHLQLIHPDDYTRFAELDVAAVFQSIWAYPDDWIMELNVPQVGWERIMLFYPIGSLKAAGTRIVGGSDWFVTTLNPLYAIEVALRRQDPDQSEGTVLNEMERVDLQTMIEAYTTRGAWQMHRENVAGSIEPGKTADLVVLDRNLFNIPTTEISETEILMTVFDGRVVYEKENVQ